MRKPRIPSVAAPSVAAADTPKPRRRATKAAKAPETAPAASVGTPPTNPAPEPQAPAEPVSAGVPGPEDGRKLEDFFEAPSRSVPGKIENPEEAESEESADRLSEATTSGTTGTSFVRMISEAGLVRAIPSALVCSKLSEGWQFIVDEPSIPREHCNPDALNICDLSGQSGFFPRPRQHDRTLTENDARRIWLGEMLKDRVTYGNDKRLRIDIVDKLTAAIVAPSSPLGII